MHKNVLWGMIVVLLITNGLTLTLWKTERGHEGANPPKSSVKSEPVVVAKVGNKDIYYKELIARLEASYGKETLNEIINREVVYQMAKKEGIDISEQELEQEMLMLKSVYQKNDDEEKWNEEIEYLMYLEELLTKDIVIDQKKLKEYYKDNKKLYQIPTMYHISHMVVSSHKDAIDVIDELKNGSSFESLAMERSQDTFTSNEGGDLGLISKESQFVPESYVENAQQMEVETWSKPIKTEQGYAILFLHEVRNGKTFSFDEVKDQIRRQMAMQEMGGAYSAEPFWSEVGVEWLYSQG